MTSIGTHPSPEALSRAASDGLAPELEQHISACRACHDAWTSTREVDALARELPAVTPSNSRSEGTLAAVLAATRDVRPAARPRLMFWQIALPALIASAAAMAVAWVVARPDPRDQVVRQPSIEYRGTVRAAAGARFARESAAPDEVVRLDDGSITIDVAPLGPGERFRVRVGDAVIEGRPGSFAATARRGELASIQVTAGTVEMSSKVYEHVVVVAGERWDNKVTVAPQRDTLLDTVAEALPPPVASERRADRAPTRPAVSASADPPTGPAVAVAKRADAPVAQHFTRGFEQLKAGDPAAALVQFDEALAANPRDALAEDVMFWRGVALGRLGRTQDALAALARFIDSYPQSRRLGEASAMAGWMLLESGRLDDAERSFKVAARDRDPSVQASAARGLAAIVSARTR